MLTPPPSSMIKPLDPGGWRVIDNAPFNNLEEDHFASTSLHLTFTEYCRPLDFSRGLQDVQVELLESYISVHDGGKWVADVDILGALEYPFLKFVPIDHLSVTPCSHGDDGSASQISRDVISIENWEGLLDLPRSLSVVRASGNPVARLAVSAVLVELIEEVVAGTRRHRIAQILVLPPEGRVCLKCLEQNWSLRNTVIIY
ncbi:hypothetical protein B0T17DRAFT_253562 [Bombardia bombarda]|uniref:Uncharacterized protein n=1 Tax=Bombardia bombarda TaxID=252184 RepID=A0AA39X058_9PEZI|nr:hypothetical protein B0T17DRAFT_253562 [Bombardia bombarda]